MTNKDDELFGKRLKLRDEICEGCGKSKYYYRLPKYPNFLISKATYNMAKHGRGFQLMNKIAALQTHPMIKNHSKFSPIQFWDFHVHEDRSATLSCERKVGELCYQEKIHRTDFLLGEVSLYCTEVEERENGEVFYTLILPSVY